jgi:tRNA-dihydrouridine synthase 1
MIHSGQFCKTAKVRQATFTTCAADRPLVVQFCGNDPETVLRAARYIEHQCDAVDLNLGCPQSIARTGHYGAFLMEEPQLIEKIGE